MELEIGSDSTQPWVGTSPGQDVERELATFNAPLLDLDAIRARMGVELQDEPHIPAWREYARLAADSGAAAVLPRIFLQLRFPVAAGVSASAAYQAAVRRGELPLIGPDFAPSFEDPDGIELVLHPTPVGDLPLVALRSRSDFEHMLQALLHRNEPVAVPSSQGAVLIGGYNNWDRLARLRQEWTESTAHPTLEGWRVHFATAIAPHKGLYQDRFVLVSGGLYSGVSADRLGLDSPTWARLSLRIRIEHECGHFLVRRRLGRMSELPLDELMADHRAVVAVTGSSRPAWVLAFLGLDLSSGCREQGRLRNYCGDPALSTSAFEQECLWVRRAVAQVHAAHECLAGELGQRAAADWLVLAAAGSRLEEVAGPRGADLLASRARELRSLSPPS